VQRDHYLSRQDKGKADPHLRIHRSLLTLSSNTYPNGIHTHFDREKIR
jgi:hypothetical protein